MMADAPCKKSLPTPPLEPPPECFLRKDQHNSGNQVCSQHPREVMQGLVTEARADARHMQAIGMESSNDIQNQDASPEVDPLRDLVLEQFHAAAFRHAPVMVDPYL